ncbi:MAG TPA: BBP7 family outer membrane beta-barrel protein [Gemmataceae bacterium]|nr:BBP7 family outer membrane beta-barrel protein [Gemmataceae bacterium]
MTRIIQGALWLVLLAPGLAAAANDVVPQEAQAAAVETDVPKLQTDRHRETGLPDPQTTDQKKADPKAGADTEKLPAPQALPAAADATPCDPCFFLNADYLLWWIRRGPATAFVTTAPDNGTGLIGDPSTRILYGQGGINYDTFSGVRLGAGWNFGCDRFWGLEASGFLLESRSAHFAAASDPAGNPFLLRPFLSVVTTEESGVVIANSIAPGRVQGDIIIDSHTRLWSYEANLVAHSIREANRRFDLFVGYRSMALDENLNIQEDLTLIDAGASIFQTSPVGQTSSVLTPGAGSNIVVLDQFSTHNRFYGGQIGGRFQWLWNCWTLDLTAKLALGVTHEAVTIDGVSTLNDPTTAAGTIVTPGGLLALAGVPGTNSGVYSRDRFAVIPEMDLQVHCDLTCHVRASFGYTGVYWSAVARPGDQIDRNVNPKLVPTGIVAGDFDPKTEQTRPTFAFRDNGFWAHGVTLGVELRY